MTVDLTTPRSRVLRTSSCMWRRRLRLPATGYVALFALAVIVAAALFREYLVLYPPAANLAGAPTSPPSPSHPFGTDHLGRDVFSRVIWGSRTSMIVASTGTTIALMAGTLIGTLAVVVPSSVRHVVMFFLDVVVSFPAIVLAVALSTSLGPGLWTTVAVVGLLYTPPLARVVQANVAAEYVKDYVAAEKTIGASTLTIVARHVLRNAMPNVLVFCAALSAEAIVLEAALSFLGLGIQPPEPSWGNIVSDGIQLVNSGGWWVSALGGAFIFVGAACINLLADEFSRARGAGGNRRDSSSSSGADETRPLGVTHGQRTEDVRRHMVEELGKVRVAADHRSIPDRRGADALLKVEGLSVRFPSDHGMIDVVSDLSLSVNDDEILGIVGESGSGKTVAGLAVVGLLPSDAHVQGAIKFKGHDLLRLAPSARRRLLGREISMVYQDALTSLNPALRIRTQLAQACGEGSAHDWIELLDMVQLSVGDVSNRYPHQLSGGQCQRVLVAMALAQDPSLVIADEPTTALDVTLQDQIVKMLASIRESRGFSLILISHDLALVSSMADQVTVMYAGRVAEAAATHELVTRTAHPYTAALLASVASLESGSKRLFQLPGTVPSPHEFPSGCRFSGRCPVEGAECAEVLPPAVQRSDHLVFCHYPLSISPRSPR